MKTKLDKIATIALISVGVTIVIWIVAMTMALFLWM